MNETTNTPKSESTGKVRGLVVGLSSALGLATAGAIFLTSGALGIGPSGEATVAAEQIVASTPAATPTNKEQTPSTKGSAETVQTDAETPSGSNGTGSSRSGGSSKTSTSNGSNNAAPAPAPAAPSEEVYEEPAAPTGADSTGYVRPEVYLANVTCEATGGAQYRITEYWAVRGGNHNGGRWQAADANGVVIHYSAVYPGMPLVHPGGQTWIAASMNGSGLLIDEVSGGAPFIDAASRCG